MNKLKERLLNGIIYENPTFVMMLGMCPTLAVTTSATNGLGMGLTTTMVLVMANLIISLMRKIIPKKVRMPAYIVVVASLVTIAQFLLQAYVPSLYESLGIYIPLIVVNCIILGRVEAYASKNPVLPSIFDGIGMGIGFTFALTILGLLREFIGAGSIFGYEIPPIVLGNADKPLFVLEYEPITILIMAPGAFFVMAFVVALMNKIKAKKAENGEIVAESCEADSCMNCTNAGCKSRILEEKEEA